MHVNSMNQITVVNKGGGTEVVIKFGTKSGNFAASHSQKQKNCIRKVLNILWGEKN